MIAVHDVLEPSDVSLASPARSDVAHVVVLWGSLDASAVPSRGPRVHVTVDVPADALVGWPDGEAVAGLLAAGVTGVTLRGAGAVSPAASAHLVAFLSAAMSHGLPVVWDLGGGWPFAADVAELCHLQPPAGEEAAAREWQDRHAYGLLYWRHGQTFATVTDVRDVDQARYVIDEPGLLALFLRLERPAVVVELAAGDQERLVELAEAGLVYVAGGLAVRAAFRLRRWPMPLDSLA